MKRKILLVLFVLWLPLASLGVAFIGVPTARGAQDVPIERQVCRVYWVKAVQYINGKAVPFWSKRLRCWTVNDNPPTPSAQALPAGWVAL